MVKAMVSKQNKKPQAKWIFNSFLIQKPKAILPPIQIAGMIKKITNSAPRDSGSIRLAKTAAPKPTIMQYLTPNFTKN